MKEMECMDGDILALKSKYKKKQLERRAVGSELEVGINYIPLYRAALFGGICSIMLPETMMDMDYMESVVKYRNQNRPPIIKTDGDRDVTMTFNMLPMQDKESVIERIEKIRGDMKNVWKQNVFYDVGEVMAGGAQVAWMDFKAFCLNESLYSMIFLFSLGEQMILGNFHCSFPMYDIWKPAVLRLLTTIEIVTYRDSDA